MDDKWNLLDHSKVFVKWSATSSVSRRYDGFDNMKSSEREWLQQEKSTLSKAVRKLYYFIVLYLFV